MTEGVTQSLALVGQRTESETNQQARGSSPIQPRGINSGACGRTRGGWKVAALLRKTKAIGNNSRGNIIHPFAADGKNNPCGGGFYPIRKKKGEGPRVLFPFRGGKIDRKAIVIKQEPQHAK